MKVIIAGSRGITDPALVEWATQASGFAITEVVSGGARGVDRLGEEWAASKNIPIRQFIPDWDKLGKRAGMIRNADMGIYADALVALWDNESRGTAMMIEFMKRLGKPVFVYNTKTHNDLGPVSPAQSRIPICPVLLRRAQIGKEDGVDITVKSGRNLALAFAPTWTMVREHQSHVLSTPQYGMMFMNMLHQVPIENWRWLTAQRKANILTLLCYCPDLNVDGGRKFCHTHLVVQHMLRRWPQFFQDGRDK